MEDKFKQDFGSITLQKGNILYYLSITNEIDFNNNFCFYFHPSEACVRRLNYKYISKYELVEEIEIPIILEFKRRYALSVDRKISRLLLNKKNDVNVGWLSCTPTGHGLNFFIPNPYKYLQKIDIIESLSYDYDTYNTYKLYINNFTSKIKMNKIYKAEIDAYIKYYKDSEWNNTLINIINNYDIEYFP
jgi:hypothetical protein